MQICTEVTSETTRAALKRPGDELGPPPDIADEDVDQRLDDQPGK